MKRFVQLAFVILMAFVLFVPLSQALEVQEKTSTDPFIMYSGDSITFSETEKVSKIEVLSEEDEPFEFISDDQVVRAEPFAGKYIAEFTTPEELKLVEGKVRIKVVSENEETFSYEPGETANRWSVIGFLFLFVLISFLFCAFIELLDLI